MKKKKFRIQAKTSLRNKTESVILFYVKEFVITVKVSYPDLATCKNRIKFPEDVN